MNTKKLGATSVAVVGLVCALYALPAWGGTVRITTADGAGADTFIYWDSRYIEGDVNYSTIINYGNNPDLSIWELHNTDPMDIYRKVYLRFDMTNAPSTIASGKLILTPSWNGSEFHFFDIYALKETSETWDEGTITWNNAPANQDQRAMDPNQVGYYGAMSFYSAMGVPVVRDLPQNLIDFLNEDTNNAVTLVIVQHEEGSGNDCRFYSKEGTTDVTMMPTLELVSGAPTSVSIRGTVQLGNYNGDASVPVAVKVELRQNGSTMRTEQLILDANRQFTISNITPGTYDIAIKGCAWLQKVLPAVNLTTEELVDLGSIPLTAGDVDGDNEVTSTDLSNVLTGMDQLGQ